MHQAFWFEKLRKITQRVFTWKHNLVLTAFFYISRSDIAVLWYSHSRWRATSGLLHINFCLTYFIRYSLRYILCPWACVVISSASPSPCPDELYTYACLRLQKHCLHERKQTKKLLRWYEVLRRPLVRFLLRSTRHCCASKLTKSKYETVPAVLPIQGLVRPSRPPPVLHCSM